MFIQGLAEKALAEKLLRWPIYPKQHHMEHLFLDWAPRFGNCRYHGLMLDEDLMGKMKYLAFAIVLHFLLKKRCVFEKTNIITHVF